MSNIFGVMNSNRGLMCSGTKTGASAPYYDTQFWATSTAAYVASTDVHPAFYWTTFDQPLAWDFNGLVACAGKIDDPEVRACGCNCLNGQDAVNEAVTYLNNNTLGTFGNCSKIGMKFLATAACGADKWTLEWGLVCTPPNIHIYAYLVCWDGYRLGCTGQAWNLFQHLGAAYTPCIGDYGPLNNDYTDCATDPANVVAEDGTITLDFLP